MFGKPVWFVSHHARRGVPILVSEFIATFGLLAVIWGCSRSPNLAPSSVASYILGAYWFTPSTSFANPAVAIARSLSDTFSGVAPSDVPGFIIAELSGGWSRLHFLLGCYRLVYRRDRLSLLTTITTGPGQRRLVAS